MIGGTSALLLVELRLPPDFHAVDKDSPPAIDEELRIEIIDDEDHVRPWQWPGFVAWHEAKGYRIVPDGTAEPCDCCGELTLECDEDGNPICLSCRVNGDWEPDGDDEPEEAEKGDGAA